MASGGKPTKEEIRRTRARQARVRRAADRELAKTAAGRETLRRVRAEEHAKLRTAAQRQQGREILARREAQAAEREYRELVREVKGYGGIRVDQDYSARMVDRAWRGKRPLDELVAEMSGHHGRHYAYSDDLLAELYRAKESAQYARARARGQRARPPRTREEIREEIRRNRLGEYAGVGRERNDRWADRDRLGRFAPSRQGR